MAAIAVVIQHALELADLDSPFFNLGRFGLALFFFLSGLVIPFSFSGERPLQRFLITRFFRLYPAYWVSLGAALLVSAHAPWVVLANVTMIQMALGAPNVVLAYWSLFFELWFYVICIGLFLMDRPIVITGLLAIFFLSFFWSMFAMVGFMLTGTLIRYALLEKNRSAGPWAMAAIAGVLGVAASKFLVAGKFHFGFATGEIAALFCFLAAIVVHPRSASLEWLGKVSYSVYLLHGVVLLAMPLFWAPAYILVVCSVSILLGATSYRFVEAPAMALGKRIANLPPKREIEGVI